MLEPLPTGFDPLEALKNERDYVVELRAKSTTGNALEWAVSEIERLQAKCADYDAALERIAGGDGYYPEIAMAKLVAIRQEK